LLFDHHYYHNIEAKKEQKNELSKGKIQDDLPHVVQNQVQTNVLSIALINDHVFLNNLHVFDDVDLNYFQQHLMTKIDEIIHDDHKLLKYYITHDYQIRNKIFKKKIVMSTYRIRFDYNSCRKTKRTPQ
jgi:hypothetical protein